MSKQTTSVQNEPILAVEHLSKNFEKRLSLIRGQKRVVRALDDVSLQIMPTETLGVVGESGCGKTTLVRCILQVIKPTSGKVVFDGDDLSELNGSELRAKRRDIQMVFQNPYVSLNPRMSVINIIAEPLRSHTKMGFGEIRLRVLTLLDQVGMEEDHLYRYPHEFSGGQLQRIAIARALALNPKFLALDEPTCALDVSVQSQIIALLQDLQQELLLTYMFISHDVTVVHHISDNIAVMYLGKVVEIGPAEEIYNNPQHPYTQVLLSSTPSLNVEQRRDRILTKGSVPDASNPPPGCSFHPRCPKVMEICSQVVPESTGLNDEHQVACHLFSGDKN